MTQPANPELQNFASLVDAIVASSLGGHTVGKELVAQLGATPELLVQLGLPNLPLAVKGSTIDKIVMDHGISKSLLKRLPDLVAAPKAVYRSAPPHQGGMVVLTFELTHLGAVMVPIAGNQRLGRSAPVNLVTSMYAKEDAAVFSRWQASGLLLWTGGQK